MQIVPSDESQTAPEAEAIEPSERDIGEQIRELRRIKRMTLQQLADAVGLSVGYLSQIERSRSKLPIGTLRKLCDVLGVHMSWFFHTEPSGDPTERNFIVRANNRRRFSFTGLGINEELLSPNLSGPLEILMSKLDPGADSGEYSHEGSEGGVVIAGVLDLWVKDSYFRLETGDSFSFSSTERHRCHNPGKVPTHVVWIITPPHY